MAFIGERWGHDMLIAALEITSQGGFRNLLGATEDEFRADWEAGVRAD